MGKTKYQSWKEHELWIAFMELVTTVGAIALSVLFVAGTVLLLRACRG